jgi:hypothetical protein
MRSKISLVLIVCSALTLCAADDVPFLDVKQGLWEVSTTHSMKGMPTAQMGNIPPDVLAKMSPDQRAKIEAMMSGKPSTDVRKELHHKRETGEAIGLHEAIAASAASVVGRSSVPLAARWS